MTDNPTTNELISRALMAQLQMDTLGIKLHEGLLFELAMRLYELQRKVDELEELQREALLSLRVADKFCGELTSDECSDSVHIPIQDAIRKIVNYDATD